MVRSSVIGSSKSDYFFSKTQSGRDGRFETVDGVKREKWNDYSCTIYEHNKVESPNGHWPGGASSVFNSVGGWATTGTANFDNLEISAINKLYNKVRGHSLDLGKSLAEGGQAVNMITDNLKRIGQCAWYLKQGHVGRALESLGIGAVRSAKDYKKLAKSMKFKDISDRFLEAQFGWGPLLSDMEEAARILNAIGSKPRVWDFKASQGAPEQNFNASIFNPPEYSAAGTLRDKVYITYQASEQLSTSRSLDLDNLAGIAWEITPWSFIGDWVIPIGPYIDALNNVPKLKGRFCVTRMRKMRNWVDNTYHPIYEGTSYRSHGVVMNRKIVTHLVPPTPSVRRPDQIFTGLHITEAVALFHQKMESVFRGSKKPYR